MRESAVIMRIMVGLSFLLAGCSSNTVIDSYCSSFEPIYQYFYLEETDKPLFDEIHKNMKRYEKRCGDD